MPKILSFDSSSSAKGDNSLKKLWDFFSLLPMQIKIAVLSLLLVTLATPTIITTYQIYKSRAQEAPNLNKVAWKTYDESIRENKIKSAEKILEISLIYNARETPVLKISGLRKLNGYSPKYPKVENGYTLNILNEQRNTIDSISFKIPNEIVSSPPLASESAREKGPIILDQLEFALTLDWTQEAKGIQILDPKGQTVVTETVSKAVNVENRSNFRSIKGDEFINSFLNSRKNPLNPLTPQAVAASILDNTLDITFIGDKYTDLNQFHNEVNSYIYNGALGILTVDPFRNRASQLSFHLVDNTSDLGCNFNSNGVPSCNNTLVVQAVNNSGAPYDKIAVIVNLPLESRGSASGIDGLIAIGPNNHLQEPGTIIHELGHTLGLLDEYITGQSWQPQNRNCYNGTPPNPAWAGIVDPSSYYLGCTMDNWYRSSQDSIMKSGLEYSFNPISKKILNQSIDSFTSSPPSTGCYQFKCTQSIPPNSTCADSGPAIRNTADCTNQWCVNNDPVGDIYCDAGATCTANPANCNAPTPTPTPIPCQPITSYGSPNPVSKGGNITFTFTSNGGYTNIGIQPGDSTICGGVTVSGNGFGLGTGSNGWRWTCTAGPSGGNFSARFTNSQNCSATKAYTITVPTPTPTATPVPTGSINGTVRKLPDNALLPGVTVKLVGTTRTTITSATGGWSMTNVPSGSRQFTFSKSGYTTKTVTVTIPAGKSTSFHVQLSPEAVIH